MKKLIPIFVLCISCVQINNQGASTTDPSAPAKPADAPATDSAEACEIPSWLSPAQSMGVPQLENGTGIVVEKQHVTLRVSDGGQVTAEVHTTLLNPGDKTAKAGIGYAARIPVGLKAPLTELVIETNTKLGPKVCQEKSPSNYKRPFTDRATFVQVSLSPGDRIEVSASFVSGTDQSSHPATLLGYRDAFARNLKNFEWSYLKNPTYQEQAEGFDYRRGVFKLGDAKSLHIDLEVVSEAGALRGISAEQNLASHTAQTLALVFDDGRIPHQFEFEIIEPEGFNKELGLFEMLVEKKKPDLRAHMHLADLYMVSKNHKARVMTLEKLLLVYEENAKEQLLTKRNDMRAAIYVGLVRSLEAIGEKDKAIRMAQKGINQIMRLEQSNMDQNPEFNNHAMHWLTQEERRPVRD